MKNFLATALLLASGAVSAADNSPLNCTVSSPETIQWNGQAGTYKPVVMPEKESPFGKGTVFTKSIDINDFRYTVVAYRKAGGASYVMSISQKSGDGFESLSTSDGQLVSTDSWARLAINEDKDLARQIRCTLN